MLILRSFKIHSFFISRIFLMTNQQLQHLQHYLHIIDFVKPLEFGFGIDFRVDALESRLQHPHLRFRWRKIQTTNQKDFLLERNLFEKDSGQSEPLGLKYISYSIWYFTQLHCIPTVLAKQLRNCKTMQLWIIPGYTVFAN